MRRGVGGKPDPIEYKEKKENLSELKQLEDEGKIDLYYLDESGFCGILVSLMDGKILVNICQLIVVELSV
jgi:hypothetical protein